MIFLLTRIGAFSRDEELVCSPPRKTTARNVGQEGSQGAELDKLTELVG